MIKWHFTIYLYLNAIFNINIVNVVQLSYYDKLERNLKLFF